MYNGELWGHLTLFVVNTLFGEFINEQGIQKI